MKKIQISFVIMGALLLSGCGSLYEGTPSTPEFGSSVRMAIASQTVNPEAGTDAPIVGIDGRYAAAAAENYQSGPKDRKERESTSTFGVVEGK